MYDLAHMGRTAHRHRLLLVGVALVVFLLLVGYVRLRPERFEAAGVVVLPEAAALERAGVPSADVDRALGTTDELVVLEQGRSRGFRRAVARRAGVDDVPERDQLFVRQVQGPPGSRIETRRPVVRITAIAGRAGDARDLVQAASRQLAEEGAEDITALADLVDESRRPEVRRAVPVIARHVDERRVGRMSIALATAASTAIALSASLLLLVVIAARAPRHEDSA